MTNIQRPDLLHLSPQALMQATNAGIVKRAQRELAAGDRPVLALDATGTLSAAFADGTTMQWPVGTPIQKVACSCGAASVCRHRVMVVLAYNESRGEAATEARAATASPGSVDDEALARHVPAALLAIARQMRAGGVVVELRRTAAGEPCDTARLPAATVRYWAGAALEAARCDCVRASGCEHVALGVWAFRAAEAGGDASAAQQVRLHHENPEAAAPRARRPSSALLDRAPFDRLTESLLRHGVANGNAALAQPMSQCLHEARRAGAVWIDHLLGDIETWSAGHAARSALYESTTGVDLLAELALRLAAGLAADRPDPAALGIGQPGDTELDRARLVCIGARTRRDGTTRRAQLILADTDTGTRLVLPHEWQVPADADAATEVAARAAERVAPGVGLTALTQGQLLARRAQRRADGSLRLARTRNLHNSVLPQAADWSRLEAPLRFETVAAMAAHQREQPLPQLLPRHASRRFVVFTPARVEPARYDPQAQSLLALLIDADEQAVLLRRTHEGHVRHALDACAAALDGRHGALRHVGGLLRWVDGLPMLEPWAFACDRVIVPDFADSQGALADVVVGRAPDPRDDDVAHALAGARELIGTLLHHGLRGLPRAWPATAGDAAVRLRSAPLDELATRLEALIPAVLAGHADGGQAVPLATGLLQWMALWQLHANAQAALSMVD